MKMDVSNTDSSPNSVDEMPNDPGKMFVGGLHWQTSPESLKSYFASYGDIKESMVMKDPTSKRSRGFGFITFKDATSVDKVLAAGPHELDSKCIDPKLAVPKRTQPKMVTRTKKIFVGGLASSTVDADLKNYFSKYGKVEEAVLMFDKTTNRHRGFGFVTFESEDSVEDCCNEHYHEINKKMVECKRAQPKEVMMSITQKGQGRGMMTRSAYVTEDGEVVWDMQKDYVHHPEIYTPLANFFPPGIPAYAAYGRGFTTGMTPAYYYPGLNSAFGAARGSRLKAVSRASLLANIGLSSSAMGFPGYSYVATTPDGRHAAPTYIADYSGLTQAHLTSHLNHAAALTGRTEPSQLSISSPPLHRDLIQRTTAAMLNNYQFAPATSPITNGRIFPPTSPSPMEMYGSTQEIGYIQATSPQPNGFQLATQIIATNFQNGYH